MTQPKPPSARAGEVVEIDAMDLAEWESGQRTPQASDANLAELVRKTVRTPEAATSTGGPRTARLAPVASTARAPAGAPRTSPRATATRPAAAPEPSKARPDAGGAPARRPARRPGTPNVAPAAEARRGAAASSVAPAGPDAARRPSAVAPVAEPARAEETVLLRPGSPRAASAASASSALPPGGERDAARRAMTPFPVDDHTATTVARRPSPVASTELTPAWPPLPVPADMDGAAGLGDDGEVTRMLRDLGEPRDEPQAPGAHDPRERYDAPGAHDPHGAPDLHDPHDRPAAQDPPSTHDAGVPDPVAPARKAGSKLAWIAGALGGAALIGVLAAVALRPSSAPPEAARADRRAAGRSGTGTAAPVAPAAAGAGAPSGAPAARPSPEARDAAADPAAAQPAEPPFTGPDPATLAAAAPRSGRGAKPAAPKVVVDYSARSTDAAPPNLAAQAEENPAIGQARLAYRLGNQKLFLGDTDGAIHAYREALAFYPGYVGGYRGLGLAYSQRGDKASALAAFRAYVTAAPRAKDIALIKKRIARLQTQ